MRLIYSNYIHIPVFLISSHPIYAFNDFHLRVSSYISIVESKGVEVTCCCFFFSFSFISF